MLTNRITVVAARLSAIAGARYQHQNRAAVKITGRQWKANGNPECINWIAQPRIILAMSAATATLTANATKRSR